jgi:hypothetical protein
MLVAGISLRSPGFDATEIHVAFGVDKVAEFYPSTSVTPYELLIYRYAVPIYHQVVVQ